MVIRRRIIGAISLALYMVCGCVDQDTAERVLANHGVQNVELRGYAFGQCSEDDMFASEFSGTRREITASGDVVEVPVSGVICCGLIKLCTVRF